MQPVACSSFAPMNSILAQNTGPRNHRSRVAISVSLTLLASLNLLPVVAQSRSQKHITSVWTATSAVGSTVHVVSDGPVTNYEAYSRGGRFYVKVPAADLPSARGSLLGRGFDDVQIQRYGDGIIISFHLLPGTTARVDQAANRLDIVFTIPARAIGGGIRGVDESDRTRAGRSGATAGPTPLTARASSSPARLDETAGAGRKSTDGRTTSRSASLAKPTPSPALAAASPVPSASPRVSASPSPTPSGSVGAATSPDSSAFTVPSPISSEPQVSPVVQSTPAVTPEVAAGTQDNDWRSRLNYWKVWAQLNWALILIGSLIVLALLVWLFFWRALRRLKATREEGEWDAPAPGDSVEPPIVPASRAGQQASAASATVAGANARQTDNQSDSSSRSPGDKEQNQSADPDREVFEL